ncbi:unnamed protein product [Schistosoma curassoni]|uniref:Myosin motor domain-containing protein n=1 Tax=Schistosoma curassoni TaxID=6186 RepID=A0A183JUB5_9TREM|nr:unnamed protein product [Schistosoma curassoni]
MRSSQYMKPLHQTTHAAAAKKNNYQHCKTLIEQQISDDKNDKVKNHIDPQVSRQRFIVYLGYFTMTASSGEY